MSESFGMMDGAYFVSKQVLFDWVNGMLKLNISRIQEFGTGAIYCQIFDVMYPGKIKLKRVKWKAKYEHEYIQNLKLLQQGFLKAKVKKWIDVPKLCKARPLDNLEMAQWFKQFFDNRGAQLPENYDPVAVRGGGEVLFGKQIKRTKYQSDYSKKISYPVKPKKKKRRKNKSKDNIEQNDGVLMKKPQQKVNYKRRRTVPVQNQRRVPTSQNQRARKNSYKKPITFTEIKKEFQKQRSLISKITKMVSIPENQDYQNMIQQIRSLLDIQGFEENKENSVFPQQSNFPQMKKLTVNPAPIPQQDVTKLFQKETKIRKINLQKQEKS